MDDQTKNTLADLAKMVYEDAAQPTMKAVGNIIALIPQAIDIALEKPRLWVAERQYNFERTKDLLAKKLKGASPENIVPPENYVAVPALQQISYCFDSDELRDMYANLLATSMQKDKRWNVHPAFVDIIKQLTPDEAKLLKALPKTTTELLPIIDVKAKLRDKDEFYTIYMNYSNIADKICEYPQKICTYLNNLERLKLIELDKSIFITNESFYDRLKQNPFIKEMTSKPLPDNSDYDYQKGVLRLTSFGLDFIETCISIN